MSGHILPKIRFEALKRDGFRCQYCGATPDKKALQVDHVVPVHMNGKAELSNLKTSCKDCNIGKGRVPLDVPAIIYDAENPHPNKGKTSPPIEKPLEKVMQIRLTLEQREAIKREANANSMTSSELIIKKFKRSFKKWNAINKREE